MTRTTNFRYGSFWIFYITCSAWTCNVNSLTASTLHGVMTWNNDKKHKSMTSVILWNTTFKFFFFLKKKKEGRKKRRREGGMEKEKWKLLLTSFWFSARKCGKHLKESLSETQQFYYHKNISQEDKLPITSYISCIFTISLLALINLGLKAKGILLQW